MRKGFLFFISAVAIAMFVGLVAHEAFHALTVKMMGGEINTVKVGKNGIALVVEFSESYTTMAWNESLYINEMMASIVEYTAIMATIITLMGWTGSVFRNSYIAGAPLYMGAMAVIYGGIA